MELDQTSIATRVGDRFTFHSTIRNLGNQPIESLVTHLNVLSLDPGVYVDPEDWSSARTHVASIPAGKSVTLTWTVQAVNEGHVVLYVTALSTQGNDEVDPFATFRATVTAQQRLCASGILPIAIGMPGATLVLLAASVRRRWRRQ